MSRLARAALTLAAAALLALPIYAQQAAQQASSNEDARCIETPGGHGLRLVCPLPAIMFEDAEESSIAPPVRIDFRLPEGTPIRIAIDRRTRVAHVGEPVVGHVVESVYAFDEPVIPVGSIVTGMVTEIARVPTWLRVRSYASGDFSPFRHYKVSFNRLTLPTGEILPIETTVSAGTAEAVHLAAKGSNDEQKERKTAAGRAAHAAKQEVKDGVAGASATAHQAADQIRNPGRMNRLENFVVGQSPYRHQYVSVGTRFSAALNQELDFGSGSRTHEQLAGLGSVPPADTILHARLILELSSATATRGSPVVAQLTEPLYSADHKLILPADSRLIGRVLEAKPARSLHRNGELRFIFEVIELPGGALQPVQGTMEGIEVDHAAHLKLDEEGGVHATDSKTRYLSTGAAIVMAAVAAHPDVDRGVDTGDDPVVRAGAGASGFGLAGTIIGLATKSNIVSIAFSAYGASASIYTNFLSRGHDVVLPKNAPMEIGLGTSHHKSRKH